MESLFEMQAIPEFLSDPSFQFFRGGKAAKGYPGSFLNEAYDDLDQWKKEVRARIEQHLLYSPPLVPLNAKVVERVEFDKYFRETITFDSAPGCTIPAYLCIPKNLTKPAPALVALHSHGGMYLWGKEKNVEHNVTHPRLKRSFETTYDGVPIATGLANEGYVVLSIDALLFGDRCWDIEAENSPFKGALEDFDPQTEEYGHRHSRIIKEIEPWIVKSIHLKGSTFLGIRTWDDQVSIDYLCSRPEVDTSRIGCIGLSVGGHRSAWLGAMDDRIKCSVVVGWMARQEEMIRLKLQNVEWMSVAAGVSSELDYPDIVSLAAPKPLLVQHGGQDKLFPEQTGQKAMEVIRQVYRKAGCEQNFTASVYEDALHVFNTPMREEAYAFLERYL